MGRSKEVFPTWYGEALRRAAAQGSEIATFADQAECERERLKFYRFLKELKADENAPMHSAACACVVQWLRAPGSQSKRVLRFECRAATDNPLANSADRANIEQRLAVEKALREAKKELGQ